MNDADFEALARRGVTALIDRGVKPYTLPDDTWLRLRALELGVARAGAPHVTADPLDMAKEFLKFMKGDAT